MKRSTLVLALGLMLGGAAQAVVDTANIQWPLVGATVSNANPVTVYSRVLKTGCTGTCDPVIVGCPDLVPTIYYQPAGAEIWESAAMTLNTGDCYTPSEEYSGVIPTNALTGASVNLYIEYQDTSDNSFYYADGYTSATPANYLVSDATTVEFTLHVTGDFHCVASNGAGPGISGSFNGWTYQAMTPVGGGIYTYDIVVPAGSDPNLFFKFRNGDGWETLAGGPFANREYAIAPNATSDNYLGYWSDIEECACDEHPLVAAQNITFYVDMNHQDPASYAGGVSIQGSRLPLTWNAGATTMNDFNADGIYSLTLTFPIGTLTTLEYKFTRSTDGVAWDWEGANNRPVCMEDNGGNMILPIVFWDNYQPPQVTSVPIDVTFSVDMSCVDGVQGVSVQGSQAPLTWTPGATPMTDGNLDGIWETTLTFPVGTPFGVEFKFTHTQDGLNWGWEDNIGPNRTFTLSDAQPVVTLETYAWDNWLCAPEVSIVYLSGQVTVSWDAVPGAISYNVYSGVEGYPVPSTFVTNVVGTNVSLPATGQNFFVVKAVK